MEVVNGAQCVVDQLYKVASVSLCSNTIGQLAVSVMVNPPDSEEYVNDSKEKVNSMERRANLAYSVFNKNPHIICQKV